MPKLAAVKSKLLRLETRNAVSDGAFAVTRIAACPVSAPGFECPNKLALSGVIGETSRLRSKPLDERYRLISSTIEK